MPNLIPHAAAPRLSAWVAACCVLGLLAGGCAAPGSRFADGHGTSTPPKKPTQVTTHVHDDLHGHDHLHRPETPADLIVPPPVPPAAEARLPRVPSAWTPATRTRPWQYVVIHHSATRAGGASRFDGMHRDRGWDELGYHFVIGNGTDTPDGAVEVGSRWTTQKQGAHASTADNRFNELGIGICLVGNFDIEHPTPRQMHSLAVLVAHLMQQHRIPPGRVIGHGDTKATACPGTHLHARMAALRATSSRLAAAGRPNAVHAQVR